MESAGLWMLLAVAIVLLATGLPAYAVLMGVSALFATVGVLAGGIEYPLLTALPGRIIGLLETDLLQALPLYVFMGALAGGEGHGQADIEREDALAEVVGLARPPLHEVAQRPLQEQDQRHRQHQPAAGFDQPAERSIHCVGHVSPSPVFGGGVAVIRDGGGVTHHPRCLPPPSA